MRSLAESRRVMRTQAKSHGVMQSHAESHRVTQSPEGGEAFSSRHKEPSVRPLGLQTDKRTYGRME
jgi:hypothetical protein